MEMTWDLDDDELLLDEELDDDEDDEELDDDDDDELVKIKDKDEIFPAKRIQNMSLLYQEFGNESVFLNRATC